MTTEFDSIEQAQFCAVEFFKVNPKNVVFKKIEGLQVGFFGLNAFLNDPKISDNAKKKVNNELKKQQGFKFKDCNGKEFKIVIDPLKDGYYCWVYLDDYSALRL